MTQGAPLGRRVVAHVRAVGDGGVESDHGWARCPRRSASVPVEQCSKCEHCVEVRYDRRGKPSSIICRVAPEPSEQRDPAAFSLPKLSVADLMARNVLCVQPDLAIDAVTELFVESGFKALPVVDEEGHLLGVVSESDVLVDVYAQASPGYAAVEVLGEHLRMVQPGRSVADVMMPVALTLRENAPWTQAAALMAFECIYHVVILSQDGRVIGMLSAADILYRLARSDGYVLPPPVRTAR
jgi:CBS domain-containing protein